MSDPIASPWLGLPRLFRNLDALIVLAITVAVVAAVFPVAARDAPGSGRDVEGDDRPGEGIIVDAQVLDIWLPRPWIDAAERWAPTFAAQDQDGLRSLLEQPHAPTLLYALSIRGRQVNGGVATITFLRGPLPELGDLCELVDVMNTAAGRPPRNPGLDYSGAAVHVVPAVASRRKLLEAIRASSSPFDRHPPGPTRDSASGL